MTDKPLDLFWFLPVSGDGAYLGTDKGNRPADFSYLQQIAQAADRLGAAVSIAAIATIAFATIRLRTQPVLAAAG